jgi:transcriptional regulator with XRE-family HTH domain
VKRGKRMAKKENQEVRAVADTKLTVLVDSEPGALAVANALPNEERVPHIRVLHECSSSAANAENLIVFSSASTLDHVSECVSVANKAHRLTALLVYIDIAADWLPYVFHQSGLRTLRNTIVHSDAQLPSRILEAWAVGAENDFIADAAVIKDRLVVRSCAFKEYSITFDVFPALRMIPESERSNFVLEEDGLLLHWPDCQVHLDIDDIRFANDPRRQKLARIARTENQRAMGAALRRLREDAGLKQSDIEGISARQVRRIEAGDRLTIEALDAFSRAIRVNPNDLLERLGESADEQPRHDSADSITNVNEQVHYREHRSWSVDPSVRRPSRISEGLRLAADSSEDSATREWGLEVPSGGSIHGKLEHDIRRDEMVFMIKEARGVSKSATLSVVVWSSHSAEPLISKPFSPRVGARIRLGAGLGIVPRDVSKIELKVVE